MESPAAATRGDALLSRLDADTRDAGRLQLDTLRSILLHNAGAGYLRSLSLPPGIDVAAFRRLVPLSSYGDYSEIIRRIADGDQDPTFLSLDPLLCFFFSGGTSTASPKLIPYFDSGDLRERSGIAHQASSILLQRLFPPRPSPDKVLWFLYAGDVSETKAGYKTMSASSFGIVNHRSSGALSACVAPPAVVFGSGSSHEITYCHLLCGLRLRDSVDAIRAPYAAGLVRAVRLLEREWRKLCDDIEHGSPSSVIADPSIGDALSELLGSPQPELARRIREICSGDSDNWGNGILRRLWPEARYIACVTTGTMKQYYRALKRYAGEDLPIVGGDYFASECAVGVNMDRMAPPEETSYVVVPTAAYFEFLPFELGGRSSTPSNGTVVDITGVEVGKLYEVVATTFRGLYRYRLGDVVRVAGFHNASPRLEFVARAGSASEAVTERELSAAVEAFQLALGEEEEEGLGVEVAEYAAAYMPPRHGDEQQQHLVVFLELVGLEKKPLMEEVVLGRFMEVLEGGLGEAYLGKRERGELGPMEMALVREGGFDELASVVLESGGGAPPSQYKPPKILRGTKLVDVLMKNVVSASFRPRGILL